MDTNAMDEGLGQTDGQEMDEIPWEEGLGNTDGQQIADSCCVCIFALMNGDGGETSWAKGGESGGGPAEDIAYADASALAGFVRSAPGCSGETLFRWAAGQGLHGLDVEAWRTSELEATRGAYTLFAYVLPFADAILAERRAARAETPPPAPILMAESDTVLARLDGPLQRIDAPPAQVAIGAPAPAEPDATKPAKPARKVKSAA